MQSYIYSYLFRRTLQDLDELMNVAPDDGRKDHLWYARKQLLCAQAGPTPLIPTPPHTTQCETIDAQGLRCCLPAAHLHGHKNADEVWGGGTKKPEPAINWAGTPHPELNTNHHRPWTEEEDNELRGQFSAFESIAMMAKLHGRSHGAIESRIKKLGLVHQHEVKNLPDSAPKGPAADCNPKFQENCKDSGQIHGGLQGTLLSAQENCKDSKTDWFAPCVVCGGVRDYALDCVLQDRCYECAHKAERTAPAGSRPTLGMYEPADDYIKRLVKWMGDIQ